MTGSLFGAGTSARQERQAQGGDSLVVEGQVVRVIAAREDTAWAVIEVVLDNDTRETLVGALASLHEGESVRASGRWQQHPRFGRRFRVESWLPIQPTTVEGITAYLSSGRVAGIGPAFADRLVRHFGAETLRVLDEEPERLSEVAGIGPKRRSALLEAWQEQRGLRETLIFLRSIGLSDALSSRIQGRYREKTVALIREDPYRLADDIGGIGFRRADDAARKLGVAADSPQRMAAALAHVLQLASGQGHVLLPEGDLLDRAVHLAGVEPGTLRDVLNASVQAGRLRRQTCPGEPLLYLPSLHQAECGVAAEFTRLQSASLKPWPGGDAAGPTADGALELHPEQLAAVECAGRQAITVITGGPGTGKTTVLRAVLAAAQQSSDGTTPLRVLLAAPTGRAARRMRDATGALAGTVHRLLEFQPPASFRRDRGTPLEADLVVVDEASMLDLPLAWALLRAIPDGARLLLVGDVDQLPSVGPGQVLADVVSSGIVPVARLHQVHRQGERSRIVLAAHDILAGQLPASGTQPGDEFFHVRREEAESGLRTLVGVVCERLPKRFGLDPLREVQVLAPMRRGVLGVENLNRALQDALNPRQPGMATASLSGGMELRPGDKVMQLRNNYDKEVFNGDGGTVQHIDPKTGRTRVRFEEAEVWYDGDERRELALAYALSVHKSQGSEYPAVVLAWSNEHFVMLQRRVLYTAVTRARSQVVIIGSGQALRKGVSQQGRQQRHSHLSSRLQAG